MSIQTLTLAKEIDPFYGSIRGEFLSLVLQNTFTRNKALSLGCKRQALVMDAINSALDALETNKE